MFSQCRRGELQGSLADAEFHAIRKDYYKALEDADEKVQLANQMYDLVDRYLRRLDSELFKFKCELEADHNGITEILEKRSLELDGSSSSAALTAAMVAAAGSGGAYIGSSGSNMLSASIASAGPGTNSQKENRYFGQIAAAAVAAAAAAAASAGNVATNNHHHGGSGGGAAAGGGVGGGAAVAAAATGGAGRDRYRTPKPEKRRDSAATGGAGSQPPEKRSASLSNIGALPAVNAAALHCMPSIPSAHHHQQQQQQVTATISLAPNVPHAVHTMRPLTPVQLQQATNTAVGQMTANVTAGGTSQSVIGGIGVGVTTPVSAGAVAYNLQHFGAGNALAAAASQAIAATQQMQQGRRTASLKASYEAIHSGAVANGHDLLMAAAGTRELTGAALSAAMQAVERGGEVIVAGGGLAFHQQQQQQQQMQQHQQQQQQRRHKK